MWISLTELAHIACHSKFKRLLNRLSTFIEDNGINIDVEHVISRKEKAKKFAGLRADTDGNRRKGYSNG